MQYHLDFLQTFKRDTCHVFGLIDSVIKEILRLAIYKKEEKNIQIN